MAMWPVTTCAVPTKTLEGHCCVALATDALATDALDTSKPHEHDCSEVTRRIEHSSSCKIPDSHQQHHKHRHTTRHCQPCLCSDFGIQVPCCRLQGSQIVVFGRRLCLILHRMSDDMKLDKKLDTKTHANSVGSSIRSSIP